MATVDWEVLRQDVTEILEDFASSTIEAEARDLAAWAKDIGNDLILAIRSEDEDLIDELRDQAVLVLELKRIRVAQDTRDLIGQVLRVGSRFAMRALAAAV